MRQRRDNKNGQFTLLKAMGVVGACGLDMAVSIVIGVLAGNFVDGRLHSSPWGLIIGLFLGLASGIYTAYLIIAPIVRSM